MRVEGVIRTAHPRCCDVIARADKSVKFFQIMVCTTSHLSRR